MQEGGDAQGKRLEASVVLLSAGVGRQRGQWQAQGDHLQALDAGGGGGGLLVPRAMLRLRLPTAARAPLPDQWAKLASDPQI